MSGIEIQTQAGQPLAAQEMESDDEYSVSDGPDLSVLQRAAINGHTSTVRSELEMGADMSSRDARGLTALHLAAKYGHEDTVMLLLEQNADISAADDDGWSPLFWAAGKGRLTMVKLLLDSCADMSSKNLDGMTAVHIAAIGGHESVVEALLDSGCNIEWKDTFGWTILHRAAGGGHLALVKLLLERGADITSQTVQGSTALHLSAQSGKLDVIQMLLENGADISARARDGWPVLHRAAESGQEAAGLLLLDHGADISAVDDNGSTALHRVVAGGHKAMAETLLDRGIDLATRDRNGLTAFILATRKQDLSLMRLLLEKGANIDAKDNVNGWAALHSAALSGNEEIVRFLLENGASIDMKGEKDGWTALHLAVAQNNGTICNILLEKGADIFIEDQRGFSVLASAWQMGNSGLVRILLDTILGGQDLYIRFDVQPETPVVIDLEQELATLDMRLHQLCEVCSKIDFSVTHVKDQCVSAGCRYRIGGDDTDLRPFNTEPVETHSLEYHHHANLDHLRESAHKGCHLCTLILFGLEHSYERLSIVGRESYPVGIEASKFGPAQGPGIVLVYHQSSRWTTKEELEIFCGDLFTVLPITNMPSRRCSEDAFSAANPPTGESQLNTKAMFYARCVRPNHPVWGHRDLNDWILDGKLLDQYPKIQSYMPGQLVSIHAIRGRFWLAGFLYGIPAAIPAHCHGHQTWGWVDSSDYVKLHKAPHLSCDCGKGVWEPPLLSMIGSGQNAYLAVDPWSDDTISQITSWMSSCVDDHFLCNHQVSTYVPLRVIDVGSLKSDGNYQDPFLRLGTDIAEPYTTLSYRWGNGLTFTTTSLTIESYKVGIPLKSMPQTFQDAIRVTRRLGLKYLWVDALCILQDSPQDWQEQSAIMDQIYANAFLNISASSAIDTWSGFLSSRNILEIRSCRHPSFLGAAISPDGPTANAGKVICPNVPRHDRLLNRDVLNGRGWILQERALSKRTLHFSQFEIYWECLSGSASEREPEKSELWSNASTFDTESQNRWKSWNVMRNGIQYLQNQDSEELLDLLGPEGMTFPCHDEDHDRWLLRNLSKSPRDRKIFQFPCDHYHDQPLYAPPDVTIGQFVAAHHLWYILVEEYTLRSLTRFSDRLPALSGLANIFQDLFGGRSEYIAGIWSDDIWNGLLWKRRHSYGQSQLETSGSQMSSYRAPSFSWAAFEGPVHFMVVQRDRLTGDDCYSAEILSFGSNPSSFNPLGEISRAFLKIRAWTIPLYRYLEDSDRRLQKSPFDALSSLDPSDQRILCVSIRNVSHGYLGEQPSATRQCLLLLSLGPGQDEYRRVGTLGVPIPESPRPGDLFKDLDFPKRRIDYNKPPYHGWEKKEITIV